MSDNNDAMVLPSFSFSCVISLDPDTKLCPLDAGCSVVCGQAQGSALLGYQSVAMPMLVVLPSLLDDSIMVESFYSIIADICTFNITFCPAANDG